MAGNYRSSGGGITHAVSRGVRAARATHDRKISLQKQTEAAKSVVSHKEKARAARESSVYAARAAASISVTKAKESERRKTSTHRAKLKEKGKNKPKNDLEVGKKKKTESKRRMVGKGNKW